MVKTKINYGIDLGTTNSAISRMENGEPVIKKTDTLKDTMPSCVYINKKKVIQVGDSAYNAMKRDKLRAMKIWDSETSNSFIEFKRTMGSDKKYYSSNMDKNFSSEELSAEVLKTLKSFITDDNFKSVVITVPAKFTINQKDATIRAAKLAGFEHIELLQEPIAASIAYGLGINKKYGNWLVFDFGGGTFDVALLRVEDGIIKVIDTEGDNYLGGKNIDYAIVDEIILPYLKENYVIDSILADENKKKILQDAMKYYAEEAKIQMSFNNSYNILSDLGDIPGKDDEGREIELDIIVTEEMIEKTSRPIFQKAINICKDLLDRNDLSGRDLDSLILVGGPTYSPILRKMLEEQITKPDINLDPLTVVSKGAALFASTIEVSEEIKERERDRTKIQLDLGYESTTVDEEEYVTVKILKEKTEGKIPNKIFINIVRTDKAWASGKKEINDLGDVIEVKLNTGKANTFRVFVYNEKGNLLSSEPEEFTIIQGSKIGNPILPYNIGIEIKSQTGKIIFRSIKGLEKNQPIPTTGIINGLKTQKQILPGSKNDIIKVPLYQGEYGADGTRAIYNEHIYDVIITGEDLPKLLPKGSEVDLIIKVDRSERITLSAYFPALDYTYDIEVPRNTTQKEIDSTWLENEIIKAIQTLNVITKEGTYQDTIKLQKLESDLADIKKVFERGKNDYDRKKEVLNNLRRSLKKLDEILEISEWAKIERDIKESFYQLDETNKKFGNEETKDMVKQFKEQIPEVIKEKNIKVARTMIKNIQQLYFTLLDKGLGVQLEILILKDFYDNFNTFEWKNKNRARMILNRGLQIVVNNPSKDALSQILIELYDLLPEDQKSIIDGYEYLQE